MVNITREQAKAMKAEQAKLVVQWNRFQAMEASGCVLSDNECARWDEIGDRINEIYEQLYTQGLW
jgi:hypothetical protein